MKTHLGPPRILRSAAALLAGAGLAAGAGGPVYRGHTLPRLRGAMISPAVTAEDLRVLGKQWRANHVRWQLVWGGFPHGPADKATPFFLENLERPPLASRVVADALGRPHAEGPGLGEVRRADHGTRRVYLPCQNQTFGCPKRLDNASGFF
jgi:hypothetical protein